MARREIHSRDSILDAAGSVVVDRGLRAVTVGSIGASSRIPTGSIYHRFRSIDELLARLWLRAVRRSQEAMLQANLEHPAQAAVDAALALYDFCLLNREDALLLGAFRRADLAHRQLPAELQDELADINRPIERPLRDLATRLFPGDDRSTLDLALLVVVDLPYGFARRYLDGTASPPAARRTRLEAAVRAVIDAEGA